MSNANLGIFHWIRESVKRSVLMGFSDAVEQLGAPAEGGQLHPQLAAALRQPASAAIEGTPAATRSFAKPEQRKRLGRSLDQIQSSAKPTAGTSS